MNYSTISNKTGATEAEDLTNDELYDRYHQLKKQFDSLSYSYETTKQELHETRRSYQTALDVQSHLNAELETYQVEEAKRKDELTSHISNLQEQIHSYREKISETADMHEKEVSSFKLEIQHLKEEQSIKIVRAPSPEPSNNELEAARTELSTALSDIATAKVALEEARMEIASWRMKAEELVNEMGEIRAASELRREELRAAGDREAVALADLAEARAMLHQYTDPQDAQPHAAKGNSIFAEVEDKRQEMVKNLMQMKQSNTRLKRELANKQAELDTLLREKQTIWEQQAGASAHHDRELIESYEERITQLEGTCERQRRELSRWFGKLCEPTAQGWLPGVLEHLKSECENLRADVLSRGAAQLASAAQVRELRRKIALLTANAAKLSISSPVSAQNDDRDQISVHNVMVPIKNRPTPDDVKKKVSFN